MTKQSAKFKSSKIGIKRMLAECGSIKDVPLKKLTSRELESVFAKPIPKRLRKHIMVAEEFWPQFKKFCERFNKPRLYDLLLNKSK